MVEFAQDTPQKRKACATKQPATWGDTSDAHGTALKNYFSDVGEKHMQQIQHYIAILTIGNGDHAERSIAVLNHNTRLRLLNRSSNTGLRPGDFWASLSPCATATSSRTNPSKSATLINSGMMVSDASFML